MSDGEQPVLDFETVHSEPDSPAPVFLSAHERKVLAWRAIADEPDPCGEPSSVLCPTCGRPILVDDDFAAKFGEHVSCYGEDEKV